MRGGARNGIMRGRWAWHEGDVGDDMMGAQNYVLGLQYGMGYGVLGMACWAGVKGVLFACASGVYGCAKMCGLVERKGVILRL